MHLSAADIGPRPWKANEKFEQLQQQVSDGAARLAEPTEHLQAQLSASVARLDALEGTSGLVYSETTASVQAVTSRIDELYGLFHSSGPAPAPAATTAAPVDPMAGGNDAWTHANNGGAATAAQPFGGRAAGLHRHAPDLGLPEVQWSLGPVR